MKRKITLSIALVLSLTILSLMNSDSTAKAQNQLRVVANTGVIKLAPNQVLRMATTGDGKLLGNLLTVRFRRMGYIEQDNIYRVSSQVTTDPIRLSPNEGASIDISRDQFIAVRGVVLSSSRNVQVTAAIINTLTGEVASQIIMANTEGDFH